NLDYSKTSTLLKFLARASKKIHERELARKRLEEHLSQLKKISTKSIQGELERLEAAIKEALEKESRIIIRQQQESLIHKSLRERIAAIEQNLNKLLKVVELNKKKEELAKKLAVLESTYKSLEGKKASKKRLAALKEKIDYIKAQLGMSVSKSRVPS
ncbi:MAG: hypothetical protein QXU88_01635, partial [Candidatus Woesearchaeota archaeon]